VDTSRTESVVQQINNIVTLSSLCLVMLC